MKKLFLIAAIAAMGLASCSNNEAVNTTPDEGGAIDFRSLIDKGDGTRAAITDDTNILGFTVTGWWDRDGITASGVAPSGMEDTFPGTATSIVTLDPGDYLFNAVDITRRETGITNWEYSPVMYWPKKGNGVYFFAYSPASSKNVVTGLKDFGGTPLEYLVPDPSVTDAQEDFLLARTDQEGYVSGSISNTTVKFNFVHALSRVKFFAKTTLPEINYIIGGIQLMNVYKSGEIAMEDIPEHGLLSYAPATPVVKWTGHGSLGDVTLDLGDAPLYLSGDFQSLQGATNGLMVMPQKTTAYEGPIDMAPAGPDFVVRVSYKAFDLDGFFYAGDKNNYKNVYFPVTDPSRTTESLTFEMGRQYNLYLTFGSDAGHPIAFSVNVSEWTDNPDDIEIPQ